MTIYALMLCTLVSGRIDFASCQLLQQSSDLAECKTTIANQTRGVDLKNAQTKLVCMERTTPVWSSAE
jgi:hypothetical protein